MKLRPGWVWRDDTCWYQPKWDSVLTHCSLNRAGPKADCRRCQWRSGIATGSQQLMRYSHFRSNPFKLHLVWRTTEWRSWKVHQCFVSAHTLHFSVHLNEGAVSGAKLKAMFTWIQATVLFLVQWHIQVKSSGGELTLCVRAFALKPVFCDALHISDGNVPFSCSQAVARQHI